MDSATTPITITHAAVCRGTRIWTGRRHADIIPAVYAETGQRVTQGEQGFLASDGKFYTRWQAASIAFQSGQTKTKHSDLFSEDVW